MIFLLVKLILTAIHFCLQRKVEDLTFLKKVNNVLVKDFALVNEI